MNKNNNKQKKKYEKPEIQTIDLAADEVMALGCKTASAPGSTPGGANCTVGINCAGPGS